MTLEQYAAIGEFVGGIAVLFSLVWVALQIRQNTRSVRSATLATNTQIWSNLLMQAAKPELAEVYALGASGSSKITPHQLLQFGFICRSWFASLENQWYQYQHGTLDAEIYRGYEYSVKTEMLIYRGLRIWWQIHRETFSRAFVAHIEQQMHGVDEAHPGKDYQVWQEMISAAKAAAEN